jgi:hypothetical protein
LIPPLACTICANIWNTQTYKIYESKIGKRPLDNLIYIILFKYIDLSVSSDIVHNMPSADIDDNVSMYLLNG